MTDHLTPYAALQLLPEGTKLGVVHLDVTDIERSVAFWTTYVGLSVVAEHTDYTEIGVDGVTLIALYPGAFGPVVPRRTGLYHVAIHLPSKKELARVVARVGTIGWPQSPTDHTETMATYFSDPDGNGIEITFETPERGHLVRSEDQFSAMLADGTYRGATEALDVDDLMSTLSEQDDLSLHMPSGTRVGHVHLHVNDLDAARAYYRDVIGFGDMRAFERYGMSDFSLVTSYVPHALAINSWNGRSASPRPKGTSGLQGWDLLVPSVDDLGVIHDRILEAGHEIIRTGDQLETIDPAGNRMRILVEQ